MMDLILHGYWRSGTSYRTRIALNVKGLDYRQVPVNLLSGEQHAANYRALNPQGLVPTLEADGRIFMQSSAIIEWLEERYPDPPLLPREADDRAIVRAMAMTVACDIHPLNNARVLNALRDDLGADGNARKAWTGRWIADGFVALEEMVVRHGGLYAFGDSLTMADCHLVPQVYSAERFAVPLKAYPALMAAVSHARKHPAIKAAHPDLAPGHP
ncbi:MULTISPECIES: maleylacetoacetate isomerase [Sphingobium]|uniref:Maleylacetoacetate isomerase n=1 Tax=Sphingobium baderi TaxID=1332080 RepID=A0A0S3EX67_9SPHN|nr:MULTISPECIES: maleylacetoacetate isomerase [Sphingobium]ALR19993.1 maleylacetoacetate isomerase [Sphingobium baderi]